MGYKRKARIVFLAGSDASLAAMAATFANELGTAFMEAKAASFSLHPPDPAAIAVMGELGIPLSAEILSAPGPALLEWADLLVTLDAEAAQHCPPLPRNTQQKHYPFETAMQPGTEAYRTLRDAIRHRIEGMTGGMRMLAKNQAVSPC